MTIQTGEGAIYQRLLNLHPKRMDLSLGRLQRLLEKLDHPERRLPPVIHIAGTNGKGSVSAYCRAFLEAAGKKVHVYTSPHLVTFNERIRLAGQIVDDPTLFAAFEHCEKINDGDQITFFEITTAAALYLFSKTPADYTILETGLGGRYDATNVVDKPALTIITPISLDHQDYLGSDLASIAGEKAGILKKGVSSVLASQPEEAKTEIEKQARQLRAPLLSCGEEWSCNEEQGRLVYQDDNGLLDLPAPKLKGYHQFDNAGLAIAAMRKLDPEFKVEALEYGLRHVEWPARLQRLKTGPLVKLAPQEAEIWLDGGHNPAGAEVVAQFMAELEDISSRPLILIIGMLNTKPADLFLSYFSGLVMKALTVTIPDVEAAYKADELMEIAFGQNIDAAAMPSLGVAMSASGALDPAPRILICGSLYLAGVALKENGTVVI